MKLKNQHKFKLNPYNSHKKINHSQLPTKKNLSNTTYYEQKRHIFMKWNLRTNKTLIKMQIIRYPDQNSPSQTKSKH